MTKFIKQAPKVVGRLGPAMQALPDDHWRAFVRHYVDTGGRSATECARIGGWSDKTDGALSVAAHRVLHDERTQAAIQEESRRALTALAPIAVGVIKQIMENPTHKDQFRAAQGTLDRAGLHAISGVEVKHSGSVMIERKEQITQTVQLCAELGLDAKALLSKMGIIVDAEFNVVSDLDALPAPTHEVMETVIDDDDLYVGAAP